MGNQRQVFGSLGARHRQLDAAPASRSATTSRTRARSIASAAFSAAMSSGSAVRSASMTGSESRTRPADSYKNRTLSGTGRTPGMPRVSPVDAVQHIGQYCAAEIASVPSAGDGHTNRPCSSRFSVERHADPVVPDNLDQPAPGSSKNIEIADMRIPARAPLAPATPSRSCPCAYPCGRPPATPRTPDGTGIIAVPVRP